MLSKVQNFDPSHPTLKKNLKTKKWTSLFIFDTLFGITAKQKNESNEVLKKSSNKTSMGKRFNALHESNVNKLKENNVKSYSKALEIPSIPAEEFNSEDLAHWEKKINKPLVIKNYLKGAPILDLTSTESLIQNHGEKEILCIETKSVTGKKESSNIGQNIKAKKIKLKDYLTLPEFENHYINNFFGLFDNDDFLNLCKGTELEQLMKRPNVLTQWFVARNKNTGTTFHCAPALNMFLNVKGRKEWFFIDPSYSSVMEASMTKYGVYCVSELEETFNGDFYEELIGNYPYMKHVPVYKTVLEEGDMLFNPPWWWHRVKNLSAQTIGIATRFESPVKAVTNNKTFAASMGLEAIKNPKKSIISITQKSLKDKENAKKMIESLFLNDDEEKSSKNR